MQKPLGFVEVGDRRVEDDAGLAVAGTRLDDEGEFKVTEHLSRDLRAEVVDRDDVQGGEALLACLDAAIVARVEARDAGVVVGIRRALVVDVGDCHGFPATALGIAALGAQGHDRAIGHVAEDGGDELGVVTAGVCAPPGSPPSPPSPTCSDPGAKTVAAASRQRPRWSLPLCRRAGVKRQMPVPPD